MPAGFMPAGMSELWPCRFFASAQHIDQVRYVYLTNLLLRLSTSDRAIA